MLVTHPDHHPTPIPSTCPRSYRTQTAGAFPFLSPCTASFLPVADVALGRCGLAGAGSGCLLWLPPCLDFSPVTNPSPGPSAQPPNSTVPFLPALMSSRLSALPENLPGHAARLHLGDLVTISSPRGFPPARRGGMASRGGWTGPRTSPLWSCALCLVCLGSREKRKTGFLFFGGGNWLYWAVLDPSAEGCSDSVYQQREPGLRGAWGWVSPEGVGKGMGTSGR